MEIKINKEIKEYNETMFFGLSVRQFITNVEAGHGLVKIGGALVPFVNNFPKDTQLYKLMTTKPSERL